jgi:hypothetical protein
VSTDTLTTTPTDTITPIDTPTQAPTNTPAPPQIDVQINAPQEPVSSADTIRFELVLNNRGATTIHMFEVTCTATEAETAVLGNDWVKIDEGKYRSAQGNLNSSEGRKVVLPLSLPQGVGGYTQLRVVCNYTADKLADHVEASVSLQPARTMAFAPQPIDTGVDMETLAKYAGRKRSGCQS